MRLAIYGDTKKNLSTRIAVHIAIDGEENNDKAFEASRELKICRSLLQL